MPVHTQSTAEELVLIRLAHEVGMADRAERYRREPKDEPALEQRALLALLDELQACGLIGCEVLVRLSPAARAIVAAAGEDAPGEALVLRERPSAS